MSVRWDDLQLLRLIDDCETTGYIGPLMTGHELMRTLGEGLPIDWRTDTRPFVRELLLAQDAGYIEWIDQFRAGAPHANAVTHPDQWLQEIRDIRLTLVGRDRARGRVIQRVLPDPDEDDGRTITGMTLEEIARDIGDTYSASQLPRYLHDSGVPDEFTTSEVMRDKWEYVFGVLEGLHDGGSAARRRLREFIGGWLGGQHHMPPRAEVRKRITAILAAQGWYVQDDRLVIGERRHDHLQAIAPLGNDARVAALHTDIREAANRYLESGHSEVAVFEAFKAVNIRVKTMTGLDLDGSPLMAKVFADAEPLIELGDLSTETGRNIQAGYRFLFMGAARGIRNPDAHEQFRELSPEEALEMLAFASLLMRRLDTALKTQLL